MHVYMNALCMYVCVILIIFDAQVNTERAIRHAIQERLPIVVVINKVKLWSFLSHFFCLLINLWNLFYLKILF